MTYTGPVDWPVVAVDDVHDGDTFTLTLDRGFRDRSTRVGRLRGWDTPESRDVRAHGGMRRISDFERSRALDAKIFTQLWLERHLDAGDLHVTSSPDPVTLDRWLMGPYVFGHALDSLGAALARAELAVRYNGSGREPRWWQVYDRGATTSPPTGGAGSAGP